MDNRELAGGECLDPASVECAHVPDALTVWHSRDERKKGKKEAN